MRFEASESSWKLFVFPELEFSGSSNYRDIDAVERTIIAICGAQTAGCLNMEARGKFAEFKSGDQTQSLLKELPPLRSAATECLPGACPSKLRRLQDLVRSIQEFADTDQEGTKYNRITEELANTMVVQGGQGAEYMGMTICAILGDEPSKTAFNSGQIFITGDSRSGRALQTIFSNVLQVSDTPLTLPFWDVISWPKVDVPECLPFCHQYMEIMEPLCVAALGNNAALACQGSFRHVRPTTTTTTDCYIVCRLESDDLTGLVGKPYKMAVQRCFKIYFDLARGSGGSIPEDSMIGLFDAFKSLEEVTRSMSDPKDPESVFIMVPIVHPGRLRYKLRHPTS